MKKHAINLSWSDFGGLCAPRNRIGENIAKETKGQLLNPESPEQWSESQVVQVLIMMGEPLKQVAEEDSLSRLNKCVGIFELLTNSLSLLMEKLCKDPCSQPRGTLQIPRLCAVPNYS